MATKKPSKSRQYELMIIFGADKSDEVINAQIETVKKLITDGDGEILLEDIWGRRDMKYRIKNQDTGYYVVINFKGESTKIKELNDMLRIDSTIIRHLIIKVPDDHVPTKTTPVDLDFSKKVKTKEEKVEKKVEPVKTEKIVEIVEIKEEKAEKPKKVKKEVKEVEEVKEEKKEKKQPAMDDLDKKLKAIMDDTDIDISI